jgi:uncharacterized protein YodC (DUF2158 family)
MSLNRRSIKASDLIRVASAESFMDSREPPLGLGNFVRLNSGGPIMMVVDREAAFVVVAWKDVDGRTHERRFPVPCVHRVSIASSCASE